MNLYQVQKTYVISQLKYSYYSLRGDNDMMSINWQFYN